MFGSTFTSGGGGNGGQVIGATGVLPGLVNTVPPGAVYQSIPFLNGLLPGSNANYPWPRGGVCSNLFLRTAGAFGAGGDFIFELYINGIPTPMKIICPAGTPPGTFTDPINTFTIVKGDLIRYVFTNNGIGISPILTAYNFFINY